MSKPRLVSGIKPSGKLHIGNYLGALNNFVALQNSEKYETIFFVADLHSMTENYKPEEKRAETYDVFGDFIAAGLDPKKSILFQQSQVPAHSEFMWILSCLTPMGELQRMTQFKEKSEKSIANVGLFTYPVLMASDILLYDPVFVPVGEDQLQHLELTRTLARKFNNSFGECLKESKEIMTETPRIMSLQNPEKKMSKSDPKGCIFLTDTPDEIAAKMKSAVTDSGSEIKYDPENKPAISNMIRIQAALSDKFVPDIEKECSGMSYSEFKSNLASIISAYFAGFREIKSSLKQDDLKKILEEGSAKAIEISNAKLSDLKQRTGLSL